MTTLLESPALSDHVLGARWFSGKGRGGRLTALVPLDWYVRSDELSVRSEIVTVTYDDGGHEFYQVVVSYRPQALGSGGLGHTNEGHAHDATRDPAALRAMVSAMAQRGGESGTWSSVVSHPEALSGEVTVFGGEQSNTNLEVGGVALVKLFRKLEAGRNLDIAVHDALARAGSGAVARLYGWVESTAPVPGLGGCDLAMIVERLQDAVDGWGLACEAARTDSDFTDHAAALGSALAQVHRALADTFPAQRVDGATVAATMRARLDQAVLAAPVLEPHVTALTSLFEGLVGLQLNTQQTHGDFHLGQTLHTPGGWRIIDFEGEPMKSLEERRLPDSKWRDVAGMVRSFGYATSAADDPSTAAGWLDRTTAAFLGAYAPQITAEQRRILAAYIADKAIYEVVYETRNRPTWVGIPLLALQQLTERN
ncbi:maltokinase N-terminal cap-like domain-containing protein [Aestuariimicrobium sp. T2.26MG-19.2B]|uniref:maltokinase N-terminal cap-like domain-containing protein n=1 Tax=Aestuariimicrobium sp. T2.26MG-19.2B TaxID=3040679 RepID=UPI002477C5B3|nr:phosphotransferase [Aestuariimicrobium sp. T2.26MG-19.2B]CAI9410296.1 Maltokinase [Aestuariimicrobium sp. T2.26MG-19.2B]